jgi:hypothetical protein
MASIVRPEVDWNRDVKECSKRMLVTNDMLARMVDMERVTMLMASDLNVNLLVGPLKVIAEYMPRQAVTNDTRNPMRRIGHGVGAVVE